MIDYLMHGSDGEIDVMRTALYSLGLDPDDLGFVGLEVELPWPYRAVLPLEWAYNSPTQKHVNGYDANPHITLLYGLLFKAHAHKDWIDGVLADWHKPNLVLMPGAEAFDGDDGVEPYSAIVLTLEDNDWDLAALKGANDRLRKLPHVNGFPVYRPHVTVGFVKREFKDKALARILEVEPRPLNTGGIDYGHEGD